MGRSWLPYSGIVREEYQNNLADFVDFCEVNKISVANTLQKFFEEFQKNPNMFGAKENEDQGNQPYQG